LLSGADLHGAIAACSADEFFDTPTGLAFDPVAEAQSGEDDAQVRLDRIARLWW
jgi:hypothetical protein